MEQLKSKVDHLAFLLSGSEKELFLCEIGTKKITLQTLISDHSVKQFFELIQRNILEQSNARVDFLGSYAAEHVDGGLIARELQTIMQVKITGCPHENEALLFTTGLQLRSQLEYTGLWWEVKLWWTTIN